MKRIKLIYALLLAVTLPLLTACYNDDATTVDNPTQQDGKIKVHLRVSQAAPTTTRAWQDNNAKDAEMMNVWTVVAVNNNAGADKDKVVGIWSCKPSGEPDQEIDEIDKIDEIVAELPSGGSYRFYSFANFGAKELSKLLFSNETTILPAGDDGAIVSSEGQINGKTLTEDYANSITVNVNGNGFDPTKDNNFGAKGIPMSNVQTFTLKEGDKKDLIVIRMLAKIKLQIYNDRGTDLTINSIKLTNLTKNENNNLKLLPKLTKGQDTMESNPDYHGDIKPNLNGIPTRDKYVYEPAEDKKTIKKEITSTSSNNPVEYVFYVNESDVSKQSTRAAEDAPDFYHFFLEIAVEGDNYVGDKKARYVMIDDSNADEGSDKWDYIARNDYRIIPIVLDDYKLDLIPYDFPAIGVYPASVKEEDGIYTINFHDYGHFHLLPVVTKYSDENEKLQDKEKVPYGKASETDADKTYWTLNGGTFNNAWTSWTDATKEVPYDNAVATVQFYAPTADVAKGDGSANIADGDDAGGVPVWYENITAPKWSADGYTGPFIFGYIADPEGKVTPDRKVYHEFSINLYKQGTGAARQMTYRLYMILDEDQMLYRSRSKAAPRCPHHWH